MKLQLSNGSHTKLALTLLAAVMMTCLFVGSANAYDTWPGEGMVINTYTGSGITVGIDDTSLESLTYQGQEWRYIYDARVAYIMNYTWIFDAVCSKNPGDK